MLLTKSGLCDPVMDSGMSRECDTCGERTGVYEAVMRTTEGKNHLEDLEVDNKIILSGSERNVMGGPGLG